MPCDKQSSRLASFAKSTLLAALCVAGAPAHAEVIRGQVVSVADGDTLTLAVGSDRYNIRLADIDAPETCHGKRCARPAQPGGEQARQALAAMALGRDAVARCRGASYDRTVCYVSIETRNLSMEMARQGWVWWEPRFGRDRLIEKAVEQARAQRHGLWRSEGHIAPWVWRKQCWEQRVCAGTLSAAWASHGARSADVSFKMRIPRFEG